MNEKDDKTKSGESSEIDSENSGSIPVRSAAHARQRRSRAIMWLVAAAVIIGAGTLATSPLWSVRIAEFAPATKVSENAALAERVRILEDRSRDQARQVLGFADLDAERSRASTQLQGLMERVGTLEKSIEGVRTMVEATTPPADAITGRKMIETLTRRIDGLKRDGDILRALQTRIATLENEKTSADTEAAPPDQNMSGITEQVGLLGQRMKALEEQSATMFQNAGSSGVVPGTVIAVGQLRESLRTQVPFGAELDTLRAIAGNDATIIGAVAELAPFADRGVITPETLRRRFQSVAIDVARAGNTLGGSGWWVDAANRVMSLVTVRRVSDDLPEMSVDAILQAAQTSLEGGDLSAAITEMERLIDAPAEAAANWLADARDRQTVDRAISALHDRAVSLVVDTAK